MGKRDHDAFWFDASGIVRYFQPALSLRVDGVEQLEDRSRGEQQASSGRHVWSAAILILKLDHLIATGFDTEARRAVKLDLRLRGRGDGRDSHDRRQAKPLE